MTFLTLPFVPFSLALALLAALLLVELVALLLGASILGSGSAGLEPSADMAEALDIFDLDADATPDVDTLLTASDVLDSKSMSPETSVPGGLAGFLGIGHSPFMIWFASVLLGFGVSGFVLQWTAGAALGAPLPIPLAAGAALAFAIGFARRFTRLFARLLPKLETTATSAQFMAGLRGVVTQGTARSGMPADVRLRDRHGNIHYMRCEPFGATEVIAEGTPVITVRERLGSGNWGLRIIALE